MRTPSFTAARAFPSFATLLVLAACGGGGSSSTPAPSPSPVATAEFLPSSITVKASAYDYYGTLAFSSIAGAHPQPISPADGSLACNNGYSVPLQIRSGPAELTLVRDQYVILPQANVLPQGTTLTCTSTWGVYDASDDLLAKAQLQATVVYDTGVPAISFSPSTVTLGATSGSNPAITLAYTSASGFTAQPVAPADGSLACSGGYDIPVQLRAGAGATGLIKDTYVVLFDKISPPAGTSLTCTSEWGVYDASNTQVQTATLNATVTY